MQNAQGPTATSTVDVNQLQARIAALEQAIADKEAALDAAATKVTCTNGHSRKIRPGDGPAIKCPTCGAFEFTG